MNMDNCSSSGSSNFNIVPVHYCTMYPCPVCNPSYNFNWPSFHMVPHKCPVCDGKTFVAPGFYPDEDPEFTPKCRACTNGIIWGT